jgi:hypothetical protein
MDVREAGSSLSPGILTVEGLPVSGPDWRLDSEYRPLWTADVPGVAWAYLRRNPHFLEDCAQLDQDLVHRRLKVEDEKAFARHWGVRFRGRAADASRRRHLLDRPRASQRRPPGDNSA